MGAAAGPDIADSGLVLALDAADFNSLNIPSQADHGYAEWYCMVSGGAVYSIINPTGGIIYENNAGTITALVTATGPQNGTISITAGRKYYGSVPINLVVEDQQHSIVPLTMAGTQFWNNAGRGSSPPTIIYYPTTYYVYSPYQTATVNFYDGVATGLAGTPTSTLSLSAGQSGTFSTSTETNHWISSDVPILASVTRVGVDKTILSPMSNYVYQRYLNFYNTTNNTTPTTLNNYVIYDSTYKVMNMNIADGSGGDCAQGLGLEYLADTYSWGNVVSDYTIVFPYTATVVTSYWNGSTWVVWDTHSNIVGSITNPPRITRDGTNGPGVEASAIQGLSTNMASGATLWKWEGTAPFYIVINDSADDEFAMLGWLSATKTTPRSGNIWTDLTGRGNNGTLTNGPIYNISNRGSFVFDGTNDYIAIPNSSSVNPNTGSFSIVAWVNSDPSIAGDGWDLWVAKRTTGTNGYYLGVNHPSGVRFMIGNNADSRTDTGFISYTYNTWAMYTAILNVSANTQTVIKNNYEETSTVTPSGGTYSNTGTLSIGADIGINAFYVNGRVAIVRLYNRALTATEVAQNFNSMRSRFGI